LRTGTVPNLSSNMRLWTIVLGWRRKRHSTASEQ